MLKIGFPWFMRKLTKKDSINNVLDFHKELNLLKEDQEVMNERLNPNQKTYDDGGILERVRTPAYENGFESIVSRLVQDQRKGNRGA